MAKIDSGRLLVPSILDRIENPKLAGDDFKLKHLKESVKRDLHDLLNTRYRCSVWPPELDQLELSVVNYGIPDFTGASFANESERESLRRIVEEVVRRFEPRFKEVAVHLVKNREDADRTVRFRIDAVLWADPAPVPVEYLSSLEPSSNSFRVEGKL